MSAHAAEILAAVLPALLIAGLLSPQFADYGKSRMVRWIGFAYVILVVAAEAVCLFSVVAEIPLGSVLSKIVFAGTFAALVGIALAAFFWAASQRKADAVSSAAQDDRPETNARGYSAARYANAMRGRRGTRSTLTRQPRWARGAGK
ncbi:hypothetical protein GCM10022288_11560 [Gryllotalpicola kribbensis]|uniref:DUF2516 family protein n=1 Tax=Gryllotalpicola kribbensis TaxID=993084 RepID=A0ABP8ANW6_9MICO